MFSLVLSIVAIALVSFLTLATVYYGAHAFYKATTRATAAKVLNQSTQVLGAAELFYTDFNRWPAGVAELQAQGYLRTSPTYLGKVSNEAQTLLASLGLKGAMASAESVAAGGNEGPATPPSPTTPTTPAAVGENGPEFVNKWAAPVSKKPTYWVFKTTDTSVCREVNFQFRGDDGIYAEIVPGLLTQCFGHEAPFTVVTTRDASRAHWDMLVGEWNGDADVRVSTDFKWSFIPEYVRSQNGSGSSEYDGNTLVFVPNEIPGLDDSSGNNGGNGTESGGNGNGGSNGGGSEGGAGDGDGAGGGNENEGTTGGGGGSPLPENDKVAPGTSGNPNGLTNPKDTTENWWFRDTRVGESSQKWVRITNTESRPLSTNTAGMVLPRPFSLVSSDCPALLHLGNSCVILLEFTPTEVVEYSNLQYPFTIKNEVGEFLAYLNGNGLSPRMQGYSISPNPLIISPAYAGKTYSPTVTVKSESTDGIAIDELPVVSSESGAFSLSYTNCDGDIMHRGQQCAITTTITPEVAGSYHGTVKVSIAGFEDDIVDIEATVLPAISINGHPLANSFAGAAYTSVDIRPAIVIKNGMSLSQINPTLSFTGLPAGLSYNPSTGSIEGTPAIGTENQKYQITMSAVYGPHSTKAEGQFSLQVLPKTQATWHLLQNLSDSPGVELINEGVNLVESKYHTIELRLKADSLKDGGLFEGKFEMTNAPYADAKIINIGWNTLSGSTSVTCNPTDRDTVAQLWISGCKETRLNGDGAVYIHVKRQYQDNAPIGDLPVEITFTPSERASFTAPPPFTWTIQSRWDAAAVLTTGYGNTAADAVTDLDLGVVAGSPFTTLKETPVFARTSGTFGRISGTWKLTGDPEIQLTVGGSAGSKSNSVHNCKGAYSVRGTYEQHCGANANIESGSDFHDLVTNVVIKPVTPLQLGDKRVNATLEFIPDATNPVNALKPLKINLTGVINNGTTGVMSVDKVNEVSSTVNVGVRSHSSGKNLMFKDFYVLSSAVNGHLGGTWTIEDENDVFSIMSVEATTATTNGTSTCKELNLSSKSAHCVAAYPLDMRNAQKFLKARVAFNPTSPQTSPMLEYSGKLKFIPSESYPLTAEGSLETTLTGTSMAGQSLSFNDSQVSEEVLDSLTLPITQYTQKVTKRFYVKGKTTFERLSGTFVIEGDNRYRIQSVESIIRGDNQTQPCLNKAITATTAYCTAQSHPDNYSWKDIRVTVEFDATKLPAAAGTTNAQALLQFIPDSLNTDPTPLSINMNAVLGYTQTAALSVGTDNTATANPGVVSATASTIVYLRGSTLYGPLKGHWELEGPPEMRIISLRASKARTTEPSNTTNSPGTVARNFKSTSPFMPAAMPDSGEQPFSDMSIGVDINPPSGTPSGTAYSGKLRFVPDPEYPMKFLTPMEIDVELLSR